MNIRIRYFASIREIIGQSEETLTVPPETSITGVRDLLLVRNPQLQPILARSVCAVNRRYVAVDTVLNEGDELVFIPPTGGGQPCSPLSC